MSVAPSIYSFACPDCARKGKSPRPIPPNAKVRCKCGHSFRAGDGSNSDVPMMEQEEEQEDVPEITSSDDLSSAISDDLAAFLDTTVESPIDARSQPLSARTLTKVRSKEPFYFRVMEIFGWCNVVIGVVQLAAMTLFTVVGVGLSSYNSPHGQAGRYLFASLVTMVPVMGISLGILVSFLLAGYSLWIIVDIARSLRHANHLQIMMGRTE